MTIFGSADGIAAKLMVKANEYCRQNSKSEAVLQDMAGQQSEYGVRAASSTIYFRCAGVGELSDSYYERVKNLKEQVDSGGIRTDVGSITSHASPGLVQLPATDAAMLEARSTWWGGEANRYFIYIQNATSTNLDAFEFTLSDGTCASPTTPPDKSIIQLERPIPAGEQALINFTRRAGVLYSAVACGVISAAWAKSTSGRFLQFKKGGSIVIQVTTQSEADCEALVDDDAANPSSCASVSSAENLPYRSIIEDSSSKDILVVEAVDEPLCTGVVSGMTRNGELIVINGCVKK